FCMLLARFFRGSFAASRLFLLETPTFCATSRTTTAPAPLRTPPLAMGGGGGTGGGRFKNVSWQCLYLRTWKDGAAEDSFDVGL
ncbi:hypothetical protein JB92DRAFT_3027457, partial [Gautieria morchelliformis]